MAKILRLRIVDNAQPPPRKAPFGTKAVNFLSKLSPGPWTLTAIPTNGTGTCTRTFTDSEAARRFIAQHNRAGKNLHYQGNRCCETLASKASKEDVVSIDYLHVDADPRKDETSQQGKQRLRALIKELQFPFTVLVDSGNGLQVLIRLQTPIEVTGPEVIADVEARNHALAERLGVDPSTRDISRLLRVPGTINYPTLAKRKLGRTQCKAHVIEFNDSSYPLHLFPPKVIQPTAPRIATKTQAQQDEISRSLMALLHLKGTKGEPIAGYASRHELLMAFITSALRKGVTDASVMEACLDAQFTDCAIHEHCADNGGQRYLERQIAKAHAKFVPAPDHESVRDRPLTTRTLSTFVGREVHWLWEPFFPRQMLTVVFGDSDVGKSTVLNDLAARLTTGRTLPRFGNEPVQRLDKGSVVILCKEDSIELMVRPRLEAAGADLEKVHVVGYRPAPGDDYFQQLERLDTTVEALQEQIGKIGDVRLLIIDPITDYVGSIDTYRDEQVRRLLDPLNGLARRFDLAIVYVLHLNKKEDMSARYRMLAGVGFRNAPRSAVLVAADREHEGRSLMLQDKKNLLPKKVMVAFRFNTVAGQPCIEWEPDWQEVVEADELLRSKAATKQSKTAELLRKWLAEGPRPAKEVVQLAKDNNISEATLHLVKPLIGVTSVKRDGGQWFWSLPRPH